MIEREDAQGYLRLLGGGGARGVPYERYKLFKLIFFLAI